MNDEELRKRREKFRRVMFPNISSVVDRVKSGGLLRPRERMERLPKESEKVEAKEEKSEFENPKVVGSRTIQRNNVRTVRNAIADLIDRRGRLTEDMIRSKKDTKRDNLKKEKKELEEKIEEKKKKLKDIERRPWKYSNANPAGVKEK